MHAGKGGVCRPSECLPAPVLLPAAASGASSGCLLGAGLELWADAVEGSGWRTKNWRGLSRITKMLLAGLAAASELLSFSSSWSAGLALNLQVQYWLGGWMSVITVM